MRTAEQNTKASIQSDKRRNGNFFFQPKLSVNQPGDVYEQEADAVRFLEWATGPLEEVLSHLEQCAMHVNSIFLDAILDVLDVLSIEADVHPTCAGVTVLSCRI